MQIIDFSKEHIVFYRIKHFWWNSLIFHEQRPFFIPFWINMQSSVHRERGKRGFCIKITILEWKINYFCGDHLHTRIRENMIFSESSILTLMIWWFAIFFPKTVWNGLGAAERWGRFETAISVTGRRTVWNGLGQVHFGWPCALHALTQRQRYGRGGSGSRRTLREVWTNVSSLRYGSRPRGEEAAKHFAKSTWGNFI